MLRSHRFRLLPLAIAALLACPAIMAQAASPDDPIDYNLNETPARPAPAWVKMIDQGTKNPALKGIFTPAGIKVDIVAQEPTVINPVGMTFADDGTPYVLEWRVAKNGSHLQYKVKLKNGDEVTVNRMKKDGFDDLKTLTDADGDGVYEKADVLMNDLEIPSSVLLDDGWIYLSSIGHVIRRRQSTPGGKYDKEEEIVRGLCGFHHHQASGMTISHDGWLFVSSGDDDNHGEGSDGSRATVLRTGAVFRMRPDGSQLSEFARGFRNPYRDVVFDHMFNMFHVDNDQEDGSKFQGVRLMHVLEGADFGWRLYQGTVCCRTDFARGAVFGELPGKMPSMLKTGRGSPAGLLIYQGTRFPEFFRGLLIYPDVYRKMVRAYAIEQAGSTFRVTQQFDLMRSEDGLFRPCQAVQGPDGAIYIADWRTDSGGAGKLWGDGQHGRIYRLSWEGIPDSTDATAKMAIPLEPRDTWAKLASLDDTALLKTLDTPDFEIRKRALKQLTAKGEGSRAKLLAVATDAARAPHARAAALGGASRFYNDQVEAALLDLLAKDKNADIRRLAADSVSRHTPKDRTQSKLKLAEVVDKLIDGLADQNPATRRAAAMAVGQVASLTGEKAPERMQAAKALLEMLAVADSKDAYLKDGLLRGIERTGPTGVMLLADLINSNKPEERALAVWGFEALRTREAAEALDAVLKSDTAKLTPDELARLVGCYRHYLVEPPVNASAVAEWLAKHPKAPLNVQLAGLETLGLVGGGDPAKVSALALSLLKNEDPATRLTVIKACGNGGLIDTAKALAEALKDNQRAAAERREIIQALAKLRQRPMPFTNKLTPPGVELVLDDLAAVASDPAAGEIRGDALALLAQVTFAKAQPVAEKLLDSDDVAGIATAIDVLSADVNRAKQLGKRFVDGKLNRTLMPQVAAALQKHAEKDKSGEIAKLLAGVFKGGLLVSLDPAEVARVEGLVKEKGDPHRGRAVYLNATKSQCAKCHKLEGVGGQIGPDLSKIWETHTVAKIMESMIDPSKEIKEGFATWTITTAAGQVYSGLKIQDDKNEVVLRDPSGKDVRIPVRDVEDKAETKKSLMPEGVIAQLNYQEFIDLVAFLKNRDAQAVLKQTAQSQFWAVGTFRSGIEPSDEPEKTPDPKKPVKLESGEMANWQPLFAQPDGTYNLGAIYPVENRSVYVLTYIHSPDAQDVEFKVWFDDAMKLLVNGQVVHKSTAVHTDEIVKVRLNAGVNTIVARVANGTTDFAFRFSVAKGNGLKFSAEK